MNFKSLALLTGVVLVFGCKKYDIHPPVLTEINIEGNTQNIVLQAGTNYSLYYKLADNTGVDHIKIASIKGFKYEDSVEITKNDFAFIYALDYDQKTKSEPIAFNVPANASAGSYRVKVDISDGNDNVVTEKSLNFVVVGGSNNQPSITSDLTTTSDSAKGYTVSARRGDNLMFDGYVSSPANDITQLKLEIIGESKNVYSKIFRYTGTSDFTLDLKAFSNSLKLVLNPVTAIGDYQVNLYVTNSTGQVGVRTFKMNVPY